MSTTTDILIERVRKALDDRERRALGPESLMPCREAASILLTELRTIVKRLEREVAYYGPPEHVDAAVIEASVTALIVGGLAGRVGKDSPSQDGA